MAIVIRGEWHTSVQGTATGNVVITQRTGKVEQVVIIPAEYNLAMCNAIHHAHADAQEKGNDPR
jgi:hypothetical protein